MVFFVSIACLAGVPPVATTLSAHTDFSSTFFRSREIRIDRRDVGDVALHAEPDGSARMTVAHTESGSTSRSKYVSQSGEHELDRRKTEQGWTATGRWTDTPTGRQFTFDQRAWVVSPNRPFPLKELRLLCAPEPTFGPTSTVCSLSESDLLDAVAVDRVSREPWLHRGDPRRPAGSRRPSPLRTGVKVLWLGAPSLRLSASRRDAEKAIIRID